MAWLLTDDDRQFLQDFQSGLLPLSDFTHEAHLRLGWIHLAMAPLPTAIEGISADIRRFVALHGKQDKYDHALTVAAMQILSERMDMSDSVELRNFPLFLSQHPDLLTNLKELVHRHSD